MRTARIIIALAVASAACEARLVDQTPRRVSFRAPTNEQTFGARVVAASGHETLAVSVQVSGVTQAMTPTGAEGWSVSVALPSCQELVPYSFTVVSQRTGGSSSPVTRVFPEAGSFVRQVTAQPAACNNSKPPTVLRAFSVNTGADAVDAVPGDGICSTTADSANKLSRCSLRAAVMEANHKPGWDLILLDATRYTLSLTGLESDDAADEWIGDLDITESLAIETRSAAGGCPTHLANFLDPVTFEDRDIAGGVAKIDARGISRVLHIHSGGGGPAPEVHLSCMNVLGGSMEPPRLDTGVRGAGIANQGLLKLWRVAVSGNAAGDRSGGPSKGAGISNQGRLIALETAIVGNRGSVTGAVVGGTSGGGLYNAGVATLEQSLLANNLGARGPAIYNDANGQLSILNSTITENTGGEHAGDMASALMNFGTADIAWSTLNSFSKTLSSAAGSRVNIGNSLIVSTLADEACPDPSGIDSSIGNWTTDASCIPDGLRALNFVKSPFRGVRGFLSDQGGFTPVLPLNRPRGDEAPADFPLDQGHSFVPCPLSDQRGRARPYDGATRCDPGAMELQSSDP
jgi:hypothetical protein